MRAYQYESYEAYIAYQANRARRSRGITQRNYSWYRERIAESLRHLGCSSAICIGARLSSEVEFFNRQRIDSIGIDLCPHQPLVHKADASKLWQDPFWKNRRFDAMILIHSLEHILDQDGLKRYLNNINKCLVFVIPIKSEPTAWDCVTFDFVKRDDGHIIISRPMLEAFFPTFTAYQVVPVEEKGHCMVVMERT